ncbi:MAG TPA: MgtC/SapB family protein [Gemmatimonadales bacterium]
MTPDAPDWSYIPMLARLALALALGFFVGIERERRRKEAGLRTFTFATLLGAVGGLLGESYALLALALLGVLIIFLNVETIRTGEGAEITTSAALLLSGFVGVLAGHGYTFTPTALAIATAALLAWKEPLVGFTRALTESELRSAILLAIIAGVVYPVLPTGPVDPWGLIEPRAAWVTVILLAALGFATYILLKLYGVRGVALAGFLGGFINSTVTIVDLAQRVQEYGQRFVGVAYRGVVLATAAMLVRNAIFLGLLSLPALAAAALPLGCMLAGTLVAAFLRRGRLVGPPPREGDGELAPPTMTSPFSLMAALKFGVVFLALQVAGTLAERFLGQAGFYAVSAVGGLVSSASAVASAGALAASGSLSPDVAGRGAVLASAASALINLPLVARVGQDRALTRRVAVVLGVALLLGMVGAVGQILLRIARG